MARLTFYPGKIKKLDKATQRALEMTGEALLTEIREAQVMPMDTGTMQNESTFVDVTASKQGAISIVTTSPQARRLYFHPEYDFQTINNENAKGQWLEDWLPGGKNEKFVHKAFSTFLKKGI